MSDHEIETELQEGRGRYVIRDGGMEAELTFSISSPTLRIADHTGVPEDWRGEGAGLALVRHLVDDARAQGFKIVPLCPFVNRMRARHPEWADVFAV